MALRPLRSSWLAPTPRFTGPSERDATGWRSRLILARLTRNSLRSYGKHPVRGAANRKPLVWRHPSCDGPFLRRHFDRLRSGKHLLLPADALVDHVDELLRAGR